MIKNKNPRRNFIKSSVIGLASFSVFPIEYEKSAVANILKKAAAEAKLNIVCIGAHPGDPEFGCGGTMAKYSDAGHSVVFLYLTRGEASDRKKTFAQMAALRTEEANISTKILNAKPMFVGQIDGNTELNNKKNDEIAEILKSLKPDVVFTHWPMDTHHDHQIAGLLTLNTWVRMGRKFHLYFYEVNSGDETMAFTPTDYVDISETLERKKKAMFAHKTQNPVETYEKFFKTMEQFRGLEAGAKVAEAFVYFKGKTNIIGL